MQEKKIALLSNVNMNFVIRTLQKEISVYESEGYGNELGILMNPQSSYHAFSPDITFLVMDLAELAEHCLEPASAGEAMDRWFADFCAAISGESIYYISDAYLWCSEAAVLHEAGRKQEIEQLWQKKLEKLVQSHSNVRIFPYRRMIEKLGEDNAFSGKMWYMGKILLSSEAQKRLCELILEKTAMEGRAAKKVLAVDLDNTLWGGLAGEAEHSPIFLSEEHGGLAYKNLQRMLLQMQKQGVLLAIVSKNNEEDAMKIIREHPHMALRPEHFAAMRINWQPKHENLKELARELNLGLDSFVFWDDSPAERELVEKMLPQVAVPDFPARPEELTATMAEIYRKFFEVPFLTKEDREKTAQYAANAERIKMQQASGSFGEYLKQLKIVMREVNPAEHKERLLQMLNKTNQFNLTTRRYTQPELGAVLGDAKKHVYLYQVQDCFGDNGIVSAIIVDTASKTPVITDFVMSCRVMGRNIENAIIEDVEHKMQRLGYGALRGLFIPTAKNKPVAELYQKLGYEPVEGSITREPVPQLYEIVLPTAAKREYYVERRD